MGPLRRRIAVYDLYWTTLGGGEQVGGTIAEVLAADHDVTLLGPEPPDVERTRERLGVDLSGCDFVEVVDDVEASEASADYDVFIDGTYLSTAVNRAPLGYYYVHFPGYVPTAADLRRDRIGSTMYSALERLPRLPHRLVGVRDGFGRRRIRREFLPTYHRYLANSAFTASWIDRLWQRSADVLYPPVRPSVQPGIKRPLILVLGRFFDPRRGHSKKQLELLEAFIEMTDDGRISGWELALVGGAGADDRDYALAVKRLARHRPIEVHLNAPGRVVEQLLGEASIFWHGAGFGEDPERHPERFEHFGISVVEAMAAGAVPVVFGAAGPAEIVRHGVDGVHWRTTSELIEATVDLAGDVERRQEMSRAAIERAGDFSAVRFAERLRGLVASDL